jgi:serine/threonine protein kinase
MIRMANESEEDLLGLLHRMKIGLTKRSTGQGWDDEEYQLLRKTLLASPIATKLPSFVKFCQDLSDFWTFIQPKFPHYHERREFIAAEFAPAFDVLEQGEITELDEFEMGDLIGRGGFGEVYKVRHRLLDLDFAIKLFAPIYSVHNDGSLDRFFREARILFKLNHPNIIRVHHVGLYKRQPYIRMELFEGSSLNDVLIRSGRLLPTRARAIVRGIVEGLIHAHIDAGVIHRDLKPSNVMVSKRGKLRILDFGLGVFVEEDIVSRITKTGESVLGGYYTAPELLQNPKLLDPRVDIYSTGAIWFTLLTGRAPAGVDLVDTLDSECDLKKSEREIVLKTLRPLPRRHASAPELLAAIENIGSG